MSIVVDVFADCPSYTLDPWITARRPVEPHTLRPVNAWTLASVDPSTFRWTFWSEVLKIRHSYS